jgi:Tfp pilus assembly protein PilF
VPLFQDKRRSVRISAVRSVLDILAAGGRPEFSRSARHAVREYQRSLAVKADFPEAQLAIAGTALVFRDYSVADRAFLEAVRMDPQRVVAWAMIARLRFARGNRSGAVEALRKGLAANRGDATLTELLNQIRRARERN